MYEYFHCGAKAVIWDADFDYADYGLEGNGIIHTCHCDKCGARIEYYVDANQDEGEKDELCSEKTKGI